MDIIAVLTIAARIADLALDAVNGVSAAADTLARICPVLDAIRTENREPTAAEWRLLNSLIDGAFSHLMTD